MAKDEMVVIAFRVKPEEQRMIERHAEKEGKTVSSYVRSAVLFDMFMDGDFEAFKHVASEVRGEVLKRISKRLAGWKEGLRVPGLRKVRVD